MRNHSEECHFEECHWAVQPSLISLAIRASTSSNYTIFKPHFSKIFNIIYTRYGCCGTYKSGIENARACRAENREVDPVVTALSPGRCCDIRSSLTFTGTLCGSR